MITQAFWNKPLESTWTKHVSQVSYAPGFHMEVHSQNDEYKSNMLLIPKTSYFPIPLEIHIFSPEITKISLSELEFPFSFKQ